MIFEMGMYRLDIDVDRTKQFYNNAEYDDCECPGCRNFAKACHLLPETVQQFFQQFGIDIANPAEKSAYCSKDEGRTSYYHGFYHICGSILEGKYPWLQVGERTYQLDENYSLKITPDFSVFFRNECSLVHKDFPTPVIQMEFLCEHIPWVLDQPNPYFKI